jgi:hypothetical protein
MWFLSAIGETGRGQQPDHQLRYTENDDGIHWEAPETFATAEEGFFDNAGGGAEDWQMVLARGTNLYGTRPFPGQGLWLAEPESSRLQGRDRRRRRPAVPAAPSPGRVGSSQPSLTLKIGLAASFLKEARPAGVLSMLMSRLPSSSALVSKCTIALMAGRFASSGRTLL